MACSKALDDRLTDGEVPLCGSQVLFVLIFLSYSCHIFHGRCLPVQARFPPINFFCVLAAAVAQLLIDKAAHMFRSRILIEDERAVLLGVLLEP